MTFRATTRHAVRRAASALVDGNALLWPRPALHSSLYEDLIIIGGMAAKLLEEERRVLGELELRASTLASPSEVGRVAHQLVGAIGFPDFVENLITGVFSAIWRSNVQQLEAISQLLEAVSKTKAEFARTEISDREAVSWLVAAVPGLVSKSGSNGSPSLGLASSAELSTLKPRLARVLGEGAGRLDSVTAESLDELIPMARLKMGKGRQQNLATLVMMGLNRIIVDEGRLHAEMDMRVDASSASRSETHFGLSNQDGLGVNASSRGQNWGASGGLTTSVAVIKDNQNLSAQEIAAEGSLRSSVDVVFHTEPVELSHVASTRLREQIIENTRVPDAKWTQGHMDQIQVGDFQHEVSAASAPDAPALPGFAQPAAQAPADSSPGEDSDDDIGSGDDKGSDAGGGDAGAALRDVESAGLELSSRWRGGEPAAPAGGWC